MELKQVKLIAVLFSAFIMFIGCNEDSPVVEPEQISIDISGDWKGNLLLDGIGNEITSVSTFHLSVSQNNNLLTSILDFNNEFGIDSEVNFSGEIANDSTFLMTGTNNGLQLKIYGTFELDQTIEIAIEGIEQEIQFFHFYKEENLVTGSYSNEYKLELKLGEIGTGRSIILVHGMDDNAGTWKEMLNYFDDHGIDETNNVWVFEYKWWRHIDINGNEMAAYVLGAQIENKVTKDPIIIAHSMGGLVSRSYVANTEHVDTTNFHRLVTLSTPHLGSKLGHFVPFGDADGVGDLVPGHDFLNNLNSNEYEKTQRSKYWLLNGRVGTYPSCYEKHINKYFCYHWHQPKPTSIEKTGHGALDKPNDGMVTNASARFNGDNNVHRIDTYEWINHSYLNKDERICKWVTEFIKDHP